MSSQAPMTLGLTHAWKSFALAAFALVVVGPPAVAQDSSDQTFLERAKEHWAKVISGMESSAKAAGDEYSKLKSEAAKATGPARAKLHAEMEAQGKKWAAAREKLVASIESHSESLGDEAKKIEAKAAKATGAARDKLHAEGEKVHEQWGIAREKLHTVLAANMKSMREEYVHLKERLADASADEKAKLSPRMEKLHAEWTKTREKLATNLKADMKATKAELEHIGEATSSAAKSAKEKLSKRLHDLTSRSDELDKEKEFRD